MSAEQLSTEPSVKEDVLTRRLVRILSEVPPGTKLPSERDFAEQLGVSRTALRDRFSLLESTGVLERRSGSGTYVRELSSSAAGHWLALSGVASNLNSITMLPVRIALEREAARLAASRTDPINLARMEVALNTMSASRSVQELQDADYAFHQALFDASGSPGLIFFSDVLHDLLWGTIMQLRKSKNKEKLSEVHSAIFAAVRAHDSVAAMAAMDAHFDWLDALPSNEAAED